jgi:hypothetical protein
VLDIHGNVYVGGSATAIAPATPIFDQGIALKIRLTKDGKGYYVLDRYGRVFNAGNAQALLPNYAPHIGEDWARDFALTEDGRGYYLLDRFGQLYAGGAAVQPSSDIRWDDGSAKALLLADTAFVNELIATPTAITLMMLPGSERQIRIRLTSIAESIAWTASTNQGWLKVTRSSGQTPDEILITVSPPEDRIGTITAEITVRGDNSNRLLIPVQVLVVSDLHERFLPLVCR